MTLVNFNNKFKFSNYWWHYSRSHTTFPSVRMKQTR